MHGSFIHNDLRRPDCGNRRPTEQGAIFDEHGRRSVQHESRAAAAILSTKEEHPRVGVSELC